MHDHIQIALHVLDDDELRELDEVASLHDFDAPISYWAHVFALELTRLNSGKVSVDIASGRYATALTKAALDGALTTCDAVTMLAVIVNEETNKTHPNYLFNELLVSKSDLRAWVAKYAPNLRTRLLGFDVATVPKRAESATSEANNDWKEKARAIADELFDIDTKNNCRDSLKGYSSRVMDKMQERNIHGPRGRIDNHGTISREALQGKKWWANKSK